jgi:hypothetical protein
VDIFTARNFGRMLVEPQPQKDDPKDPDMGDLGSFALKSHSTSRQDLWPEVLEALKPQLTTRRKRATP